MKPFVCLCLLLFLYPFSAKTQVSFDPKFKAKETIYLLRHGKFETVISRMDPILKRILNEDKLMGMWDVLEMSNGSIQEVGEPEVSGKDKLFLTVTALQYEKKKVGLKIVFNPKGEICALFLVSPKPIYQHPDYINPFTFDEYKKTLPVADFPVSGLLTLPRKGNKFPVVIMVSGMGAMDKDLSVGPNKLFKDLAWGLADNGVASFRFDRRKHAYPDAYKAKRQMTLHEEYLRDLKEVVRMLKLQPEIDSNQILILGHELGGYLIPYFAKNFSEVSGFVGFSAQYSLLPDLLISQAQYLMQSGSPQEKKEYAKSLGRAKYAKEKLSKLSPVDSLPVGTTALYLQQLNENGPRDLGSFLMNKRVLFIQGGRDFQVPFSELEKWKQLDIQLQSGNWSYAMYARLNHYGMEGDGPSLPSEYEKSGNVPLEVVLRIAGFALYANR